MLAPGVRTAGFIEGTKTIADLHDLIATSSKVKVFLLASLVVIVFCISKFKSFHTFTALPTDGNADADGASHESKHSLSPSPSRTAPSACNVSV